ncbi:MAG TPA: VWA domain-containing protein [Thermoanaerobaculia bacterium]|nr:VWA domain-containing protein [Thermoanaerobaculia bacterium]
MIGRIAGLLAGVFASFAVAQEPLRESLDVEVTTLTVVVTDAKGHPVRGLSRRDFEVLEDGKRREITNLSEYARQADGSGPAPRLVMLVIDNSGLTIGGRKAVLDAVRGALEELIRPGDRLMIATLTRTVAPRLRWTGSHAEIERALEEIESDAMVAGGSLADFEKRLRDAVTDARVMQARGIPGGRIDTVMAAGREYGRAATFEVRQAIASIAGALNFFGPSDHRKAVILVGGGLAVRPAAGAFQMIQNLRDDPDGGGGASRVPGVAQGVPLGDAAAFDVSAELRELASIAARKGIALYGWIPDLDRSAERSDSRAGSSTVQFATESTRIDGYQMLAAATGGAVFAAVPPRETAGRIVADLDAYYSLGFRPSGRADAKLVVKGPRGTRVRFSRGAVSPSPELQVAERVIANHLAGPESSELPIALHAAAPPAATPDGRKVPLRILIPVRSLTLQKEGGEWTGGFSVFVSMGDASGSASPPNRQTHQIRWPDAMMEQMRERTIGFAVDVVLVEGRTQISVGVLDQRSGKAGYSVLKVGG